MRWLAKTENRRMVGRGIAMLLASALFAAAINSSLDADRKRGESLTREGYEKNYETYRAKLIGDADNPGLILFVIVVFGGVAFAAIEGAGALIGIGVGAADEAMERRRAQRQPGVMDDTDQY